MTDKIWLEDLGEVKLKRIKGLRGIRLSVTQSGAVQAQAPLHMPKRMVEGFVRENKQWILKSLHRQIPNLELSLVNGFRIGSLPGAVSLQLRVDKNEEFKFQQKNQHILVAGAFVQENSSGPNTAKLNLQQKGLLDKEVVKALRQQAKEVLTARLKAFSKQYSLPYNGVTIRNTKTRWGSCSGANNISLNLWICILPEDLADYILFHELAHTKHKHHQADFWSEVARAIPNYKILRTRLKSYNPAVWWSPPQ